MTDQEIDALIGKMVDSPASLTAEEMEAIASDPELREIYEASARLADALVPEPSLDAEEGWRQLRPRLMRPRKRAGWLWRAVAAVAAAVAVSVTFVLLRSPEPEAAVAEVADEQPADTIAIIASQPKEPMMAVAEPQQAPARSPSRKAAKPQPDPQPDPQEELKLEHARIDHEVAMAMAEVYMCSYQARQEVLRANAYDTSPEDMPAPENIDKLITL